MKYKIQKMIRHFDFFHYKIIEIIDDNALYFLKIDESINFSSHRSEMHKIYCYLWLFKKKFFLITTDSIRNPILYSRSFQARFWNALTYWLDEVLRSVRRS